eukprot:SAG11_NODE_4235_length_1995_cov_1.649789_1_plen_462_part_01
MKPGLHVSFFLPAILVCYAHLCGSVPNGNARQARGITLALSRRTVHRNLRPHIHDSKSKRAQKDLTEPVDGDDQSLGSYYATIHLGAPARAIRVILDTGSSTLAIPSVDCETCVQRADAELRDDGWLVVDDIVRLYSPHTSSTASTVGCHDVEACGNGGCRQTAAGMCGDAASVGTCEHRAECQDDLAWYPDVPGLQYANCAYFSTNDPGCRVIHDYGQRTHCPQACEQCGDCCTPDGLCSFNLQYVDGSGLQGGLVKDQLILGSLQAEVSIGLFTEWTPRSVGFGGGTQDFFASNPLDGIFGLGFSSRNCMPTCQETPMDRFVSENSLPNIFALCLKAHGIGSQQSSWDIGFVDENKYSGLMHYVPITSDDEYTISGPSAVRIGGHSVDVEMEQWGEMLVDTGATRMYVPQFVYLALQATFSHQFAAYAEMWGAVNGCMVVDCDLEVATVLPELEVDFVDE